VLRRLPDIEDLMRRRRPPPAHFDSTEFHDCIILHLEFTHESVDEENSNTSALSERDLHDPELLVGLPSFALDPAACGEAFL